MAIGNLFGSIALSGGRAAWKATAITGGAWLKAGLGGRLAIGAGVGALGGLGYGALSGDDLTAEARISSMIKGLSSGVALGLAAPAVPAALRGMGVTALKAPWDLAKSGWSLGRVALRYPGYAAGLAAIGVGAHAMYGSGAPIAEQVERSNQTARLQVSYSQNAAQYEEMQQFGIAPSPLAQVGAHANFMNSTQGLVQGLARGRHG